MLLSIDLPSHNASINETNNEDNESENTDSLLNHSKTRDNRNSLKRNVKLFLCNAILLYVCGFIVGNFIYRFMKWDVHLWFKTAVIPSHIVGKWNETYKDEELHKLSRWDGFTASQWKAFVRHSYTPFHINPNETFRYLEIGVGVGAWSRILLSEFPNAIGEGLDLEPETLSVAQVVLPESRIKLQLMHMINVPQVYAGKQFDFVFIPGTLCYADDMYQIKYLLSELVNQRVLKKGGKLSATMLASATSQIGSCETRIPKGFWFNLLSYSVIKIEDMNDWELPHGLGRYAIFLTTA